MATKAASTAKKSKANKPSKVKETGVRVQDMAFGFDNAVTASMVVDRDFVVKYVNRATKALFTKYLSKFQAIWPRFNPDEILGMNIDSFHKNPAHQRQLLSDPNRLPYQADIQVGTSHLV